MVAIINGPNGKYVIPSFTLFGVCMLYLVGYGMKSGYEPSLSYKDATFAFTKASCHTT